MAIVQSFGALQSHTDTNAPLWGGTSGSLNLYGTQQSYAMLYATQPNIRVCVDFLARNVAQLTPHVYRRVSDTDRERLSDHDVARWLSNPNPSTRRYRLFESLMGDMGVYSNAYWAKVRYEGVDGREAIGLIRLPPYEMTVEGGLLPTKFVWTTSRGARDFKLSEVVHFSGFNPLNGLMGLSPLETLRRVLAEEAAAGEYRQQLWSNAARMEGIIERPATAGKWLDPQRKSFRDQWQQFAASGAKAGMTAVLEDGMTYRPISSTLKDAEGNASRKLTREECASAYHIPLPFVGILEHATFSNVKEQHKHLYQDTLGPWLEMIEQEIEGQLLIEAADQDNVYVEFNIDAKLAGSMEERAQSIQLSTGRPWRTVNEARALENLPRIDDPECDAVAPQQGGPASNGQDAIPDADTSTAASLAPVIEAMRTRQRVALSVLPVVDRPVHFAADLDRWNRELSSDLSAVTGTAHERDLAASLNASTLAQFEADALTARLSALEAKPAPHVPMRRSFERDPKNGLVVAFTDAALEQD